MSIRSCLARLCCCCPSVCESRDQQILDGGPPATPGHQFNYTFSIHADEASASFNTEQSMLRIDLLDNNNQYMTNLVVPCYVFKFKARSELQHQKQEHQHTPVQHGPAAYKSMSLHFENWPVTNKSSVINFNLIRRGPLHNLASVRLTHDCYAPDAQLTLKQLLIRDDLTGEEVKADLQGAPIKALHVCPPSGLQVFPMSPAIPGE